MFFIQVESFLFQQNVKNFRNFINQLNINKTDYNSNSFKHILFLLLKTYVLAHSCLTYSKCKLVLICQEALRQLKTKLMQQPFKNYSWLRLVVADLTSIVTNTIQEKFTKGCRINSVFSCANTFELLCVSIQI